MTATTPVLIKFECDRLFHGSGHHLSVKIMLLPKPSRRVFLGSSLTVPILPTLANAVDPDVMAAEKARIAVIEKVRPSVVCVCSYGGGVVGSGVLISADGYALTNYHVTDSISPVMQGGLADGLLYDAVIVGQDRIGDVALIKLLPRKPGTPFPFAVLGDSDACRVSDWSLAMGNPFGLASDFTPTVTYGIISGVNRYQPPEGAGFLEYTDCIQIETSINPGNSGGPLYNMSGELIGINGRGSFDKRGRVNSGVGYAISINQIKHFLGLFKAGHDTDHATLGATVQTKNDDGALSNMTVNQVLEESDAFRRGIKADDELISFAGRPITSVNQYKNILGIYPKDWRLPLVYRRDNARKETLVRLMHNMDVAVNPNAEPEKKPAPKPKGPPDPNAAKAKKSPAMKLFKEKKGFANYYFNEIEKQSLWQAATKHHDFTSLKGNWIIGGTFDCNERKGNFLLTMGDISNEPEARIKLNVEYVFRPLKADNQIGERLVPDGSGGLLSALYQLRHLLTEGVASDDVIHGGTEPIYPLDASGQYPADPGQARVMCHVLRTRYAAVQCKFYFDLRTHRLAAMDCITLENEDPCEVYFSDYQSTHDRSMPGTIQVRVGEKYYGMLKSSEWKFGTTKSP
jgi:serine protease Do